jgi:hypothetical protein
MSVEVFLMGRLGNNLFQYALGRIIAEHLGFELTCSTFPLSPEGIRLSNESLKDTQSATLFSTASEFINAPLHIPGKRYLHPHPTDDFVMDMTMTWKGQTIDLAGVLADHSPRKIRLMGFFQRYEYYRPYLDKIRHWFAVPPAMEDIQITASDILVNIRGGSDFNSLGWTLDPAYYMSALKQAGGAERVFACGVGIDATVRDALAPFNPVYVDGTPMEHFRFIQRFNRVVISNSSFSWWAALLSSAQEIYIPQGDGISGYSSNFEDVDLDVDDGRYIRIPCSFLPSKPPGNPVAAIGQPSDSPRTG